MRAVTRAGKVGGAWRAESRGISLGSVLSVAAELMDPDKVKAVETGQDGPVDSYGDELLYRNRLTDYHLPRLKEAPRYRQKAKTGE